MKQMQNTDYEYLKKKIKDMEPAVENPEELTRSILDKIMELSVRKKTDKRLLFTTWLSSVAAIFLLLLLGHETLSGDMTGNNTTSAGMVVIPEVHDISTGIVSDMDYSEKSEVFFSVVKSWRSDRIKREKQMNKIKDSLASGCNNGF